MEVNLREEDDAKLKGNRLGVKMMLDEAYDKLDRMIDGLDMSHPGLTTIQSNKLRYVIAILEGARDTLEGLDY
jgi:hypothetical protein